MGIINDGFKTIYSFSLNGAIKFEEKSIKPPGVSAGGENDTTTMRRTAWRTKQPKKLKTLTASNATVAYDPLVYPEILAMIGVNQQITITYPDNKVLTFWGWLDEFEPDDIVEGAQPEASITVIPSNQNDSGVETPPTLV